MKHFIGKNYENRYMIRPHIFYVGTLGEDGSYHSDLDAQFNDMNDAFKYIKKKKLIIDGCNTLEGDSYETASLYIACHSKKGAQQV